MHNPEVCNTDLFLDLYFENRFGETISCIEIFSLFFVFKELVFFLTDSDVLKFSLQQNENVVWWHDNYACEQCSDGFQFQVQISSQAWYFLSIWHMLRLADVP